VGVGISLDLKV